MQACSFLHFTTPKSWIDSAATIRTYYGLNQVPVGTTGLIFSSST
uniref:Uncharacterized protein n=1 Tax=Arundo donax TaxID=35708 RepID=A0A0A9H965_ARUDO